MPLPKPPASRATILPASSYDTQAAPKAARHSPRAPTETHAGDAAPLQLRDDRPQSVGAAPTRPTAPATPPKAARSPAPQARTRRQARSGPPKLFVLDTNVLMHDPMSIYRFDEHDIYLPMITLEELDGHKKGMSEVARNARQVSRELDALATDAAVLDPKAGIELAKTGHREAGGKLYFQTTLFDIKLPAGLPQGKADNQIQIGRAHV